MRCGETSTQSPVRRFRRRCGRFSSASDRGAGVEGRLEYWTDYDSPLLEENRHIVVWLPPAYDAQPDKRFEVIYMHDGQNLFDPRIAYTGVDWGVDEAAMRGERAGRYEAPIIVGIWNTTRRLYEYSPWHDGPTYARFVVEELKPKIDQAFRTLDGPAHTYTMGSSMGGLISMYLVQNYPDTFGACGCVSTHVSWSPQMIEWFMGRDPTKADPTSYLIKDMQAGAAMPANVRLYFDYGTEGL
ncbi:MAG: alpha/beta hydrolase-fold protein, partial [Pseudomonadota bacterium]